MSDRLLKESDVLEAILGWETDPLDEELERAVKAIPSADTSECTCCEYRVGDLCCYSDVDIKQDRPQGWVSCSERLPNKKEMVLITNDKGNVRCGQFRGTHGKYWIWKGNTLETVLAWMYLPDPFEGADNE